MGNDLNPKTQILAYTPQLGNTKYLTKISEEKTEPLCSQGLPFKHEFNKIKKSKDNKKNTMDETEDCTTKETN